MRTTYRLATAVTFAAAAAIIPATAFALPGDGGEEDESGYSVSVQVRFTGDAAPGDGGTETVALEPICWWEPIPSNIWLNDPVVDATDPESVYEWYQIAIQETGGSFSVGRLAFPNKQVFLDAIEREENGDDVTWYRIASESPDKIPCSPYVHDVPDYYGDQVPVSYAPFAAGDPPEPAVDPEDLAEEARDIMVIDEPEIDRNPQMAGTLAGATLVNVPTWFWVENPEESIGGAEGERSIRAEVVGSDVWAEVAARTGGLSVASPAGSTFCEPSQAITAWSPGASDAGACFVQFSRASVAFPGGYPVSASTEWSASWEGVTQNGEAVGGDLDPLSRSTDVNVPVAEIQSVVGLRD